MMIITIFTCRFNFDYRVKKRNLNDTGPISNALSFVNTETDWQADIDMPNRLFEIKSPAFFGW